MNLMPHRLRQAERALLALLDVPPVAPPAVPTLELVSAEPAAPGWLESTLDLRQGLEVTEHHDAAPVCAELPLSWFLH